MITTSSLTLSETIKELIKENGPISFYAFMEIALYAPETGYYTSTKDKIGINGDYYTSPIITPLLGKMIGKQLEEMWHMLDKKAFAIVEYGAGSGSLCHDILLHLKDNKELYKDLTYYIIEKSPSARQKEKTLLTEKVSWIESISDIAPIKGCILSNEVLDNFPIHRVVMKDELMEVFVGYQDGFYELLCPAPKAVKEYFKELNVHLPKNFCTEVNLDAIEWVKEIAGCLQKGFVLTIDYGYPSNELYRINKRLGTLVSYNKHTLNNSPYTDIGKQDITSHVNFSALHHWGLKYGLDYCGFTNQAYFLLALGLNEYLRKIENDAPHANLSEEQKAFFTNTFLADMGSKLKVFIQQKGMSPQKPLGVRFSARML